MDVPDGALDPVLGETIEPIIDEGFAAHSDQGLRYLAVERLHPCAEPGGEHHRAFGSGHAFWRFAHQCILPQACSDRVQSRYIGNIPSIERLERRGTEGTLQIWP